MIISHFEEKDNRTPEQEELISLGKENQRLMMDDILKQAALIMGRNESVQLSVTYPD